MNAIESFDTLTLEDLNQFIERKQEENLHLDFKTLKDATLSSGDDKRNFSRALSGFANSSGGVIVWGVDARKNSDGVDCACELKPIARVIQLLGRLNALTGDAVDPTVPGVRHRIILLDTEAGFVVTLVPESDVGPHMAKLGDDHYYKRSGESFYKMEHYDIGDMFGRRRKPKLHVIYRVTGIGNDASVILGLKNEGRATARAPFVAFGCEGTLQRDGYGLDGNRTEGLTFLRFASAGLPWAYGGSMDFALHPAMAHDVARLSLGLSPRPPPTKDVIVRYVVACEDQSLESGEFVIPIQELQ